MIVRTGVLLKRARLINIESSPLKSLRGKVDLQVEAPMEIASPPPARRFLIVDDNPGFRKILRGMVESHLQWSVLGEAADGRAAVELARADPPDIVLMDVVMPVLNGIQATKQIKHLYPATRIIVFSAYPEEEFRQQSLRAGADFFISKEELDEKKLGQMLESLFPATGD